MATDKSLIQKLQMGMVGMVITQHFWEHEVQHKVIRRFRWAWGEFLDVWMAGKYSKKPNESRFCLCYYIILICILLKFGRKTSTTIFTTFKLGTFPWTCRVHFKNMSHIDLVRFERNVSWSVFVGYFTGSQFFHAQGVRCSYKYIHSVVPNVANCCKARCSTHISRVFKPARQCRRLIVCKDSLPDRFHFWHRPLRFDIDA